MGKIENRIIILILLLTSLLSAQRQPMSIYPDAIRKIKERDTLIVAQFGGERAGFFSFDDESRVAEKQHYNLGEHTLVGYDIELAYRIADELEVSLLINREYESFNSVAYAVAKGEADIAISKLSVTSQRAEFLNYTTPYISLRMALLINRMSESERGVDKSNPLFACEQRGAKIGVLDNSSFVNHCGKLFPKAEVKLYSDQSSLFKAVENGEILAVLYEEYEIGKYMRQRPDLPIYCHKVEISGESDDIAMAVANGNSTLLQFLNIFIKKENISPSVQYIIENYIPKGNLGDTDSNTEISIFNSSLYTVLALSILLIVVWFSFSKKTVNQKGDH